MTNNVPLRLDDLAEAAEGLWRLDDAIGYRSLVVVPVTVGNVAFGVITLDGLEAGAFDDDDVALLWLMAGSSARR